MQRQGTIDTPALLQQLRNGHYQEVVGRSSSGFAVAVCQRDGRSWFTHNLGASAPTQAHAESILADMASTVRALAAKSSELAAYLAEQPPLFVLEVCSGPMDFLVCTWDGIGPVDWKTKLKNQ
jgi:hypothetical protein